MCNNRPKDSKVEELAVLAIRVLKGESLSQIAKTEGTTEDNLLKNLREIQNINPYLFSKLGEILPNLNF